jgi:ankyrin repeat protein
VEFAALLLGLGADPNAADGAGHVPLYTAGNRPVRRGSRNVETGGELVRVLVRCGAEVDTRGGVKECAPLHMAARRGNLGVAAALLEAGADLEIRDAGGDTPLRRAVNCGKPEMAAFLLAHGADPRARGSRGLTPVEAARGAAMRAVLAAGDGATTTPDGERP